MTLRPRAKEPLVLLLTAVLLASLAGCAGVGGYGSGTGNGSNSGGTVPTTPTGLMATAGDAQASLTWTASTGATSYYVKRGTTTGGPYTHVAAPSTTSFADTGLANGTTYFYVVSAF